MIKNINRNGLIITLLFVALLVTSFYSATEEVPRPYDLNSTKSQGLAMLRLWLDDLGYEVAQTGQRSFGLEHDGQPVDLLFVFLNQQPYTDDEAIALANWVNDGGTLVLVGPDNNEFALVDTFGVVPEFGSLFARSNRQRQPLLPDADGDHSRPSMGTTLNVSDAPNTVPVFGMGSSESEEETPTPDASNADSMDQEAGVGTWLAAQEITVAVQKRGKGTVWHLVQRYEPINELLREPEVAQLVVAFLRTVPAGGTILFDTYHLFGAEQQATNGIRSVRDWLYRSAIGQATLFAALATMLYLFVQGRRLGPPLPSTTDPKRREAAEYVEAMAGLHRRANQREAVAIYHKQRLKAALGQPLHIDPSLADATFIDQLQRADHRFSETKLTEAIRLLRDLGSDPSEAALIDIVADVDLLLNK